MNNRETDLQVANKKHIRYADIYESNIRDSRTYPTNASGKIMRQLCTEKKESNNNKNKNKTEK